MATKGLNFNPKEKNSIKTTRKFSPSKTDLHDELKVSTRTIKTAINSFEKSKPKFIKEVNLKSTGTKSRETPNTGRNLAGIRNFNLTGTFSILNNEELGQVETLKSSSNYNKSSQNNEEIGEKNNFFKSQIIRRRSEREKSSSPPKSRFYNNSKERKIVKGPKLELRSPDPINLESDLTLKSPLLSSRFKNPKLYKNKTANPKLLLSRRSHRSVSNPSSRFNNKIKIKGKSLKTYKSILKKGTKSKWGPESVKGSHLSRNSSLSKVQFNKKKMIVAFNPNVALNTYAHKLKRPNYRIV